MRRQETSISTITPPTATETAVADAMDAMDSPGPVTPTMAHPFAHTKARLEIIPNKIDIEEESRLYDALCEVRNTHITLGFH